MPKFLWKLPLKLHPTGVSRLVMLVGIVAIAAQGRAQENASGGHIVLTQGNGILAIVAANGEIVWQMDWIFDQFQRFGNSVSNSQLLDVKGSLR